MSEIYEVLVKMKSVARDKGWFAYKQGTPENEAYHAATTALNNYSPEVKTPKKKGK